MRLWTQHSKFLSATHLTKNQKEPNKNISSFTHVKWLINRTIYMVLYLKKEMTFSCGSGVKSVAACELLDSGNLSYAWMWLTSHG